ncbi:MAG: hypothetical protein A2Z99_03605 [Treponema sp. GWB1_62_6]|nr:MAG: hypothetical protein A2001_06755 [Treponema sp. GWC1_61_84]OHE66534.1 MAG: hypothetical protein A2Z99_03605 [Treponema sp. GWB1_62_6]
MKAVAALSGVFLLLTILPAPAPTQTLAPSPAQEAGSAGAEPGLSFIVEAEPEPEAEAAATPAEFSATIGREEVAAAAVFDLSRALQGEAGVNVVRYGSAGQGAYASVRGSTSEQVLVLLNGRRLNSAQGGGVDFSRFDPDTVERVEIIRGGASARYGENALGGVVNIVTRKAAKAENGGALTAQYGSWNTAKFGATLEGMDEAGFADGFISASLLSSEGAYGYPDGQGGEPRRDNSDLLKGDLYGTFDLYPKDDVRLSGELTVHADEKGVPGIPEFPTESARMSDSQASAAVAAEWKGIRASARSSLSADFRRRIYEDPDSTMSTGSDEHRNFASQADMEGRVSVPLPWKVGGEGRSEGGESVSGLVAALTLRMDTLRSTSLVRSGSLDQDSGEVLRFGASAGLRSTLPLPSFLPGSPVLFPSIRFDGARVQESEGGSRSDSGSPTWQVGLSYPIGDAGSALPVELKANVGTSYRVPSFDDLFWPSTAFASGNPGLLPESALSWDAGFRVGLVGKTGLLRAELETAYFDSRIRNLIVWTPGAGGKWRPSNEDEGRIRGVELRGNAGISIDRIGSDLSASFSATWLDARNASAGSTNEGKYLPGRPPFVSSVSLDLKRDSGAYFGLGATYTSFRYITARNTKALEGYQVIGLGAGTPLGKRWFVRLRLENLLDARYVDLRDYPVPGREFSIRTSYEF